LPPYYPGTMSRTRALLLVAALFPLAAASCVFVAGAAVGAGVVYALGEDSVEVFLDAELEQVHAAARAVLAERGEIREDTVGARTSHLEADWDGRDVEVDLERATDATVRMVVGARRFSDLAPDQDTARRVADLVAARLRG